MIVEVPFTDHEDFDRGGNLPLQDAVELALADLEDFWTVLFAEVGADPWVPISGIAPSESAFQRFDAYRSGFMEGTTACNPLLAG